MRCSKCAKDISSNVSKCPFCDAPVNLFELPKLKDDVKQEGQEEINEVIEEPEIKEETVLLDFDDNKSSSLKNETVKKEEVKKEIKKEEKVNNNKEKKDNINDIDFSSNLNILKRKFFFKKVILITLAICLVVVAVVIFISPNFSKTVVGKAGYNEELASYYKTYSVPEAEALLKVIHDNDQVLKDVQESTLDKFYTDIKSYSKNTYDSRSKLIEEVEKTRKHINKLYDVYYLDDHNNKIKLINHDEYNDLMIELDDITESSKKYYLIMELYEASEYVEISKLVSDLDKNNYYYNEILSYAILAANGLIEVIENDVNRLLEENEANTEEEIMLRNDLIYSVLVNYAELYDGLNLYNNAKFKELLNNYKN